MVIGGASGIGAATARALAEAGWSVVVADVAGGDMAVDVTDEPSVEALFAGIDRPIGAVVNCAGVSTLGNVVDLDVAEFRRVVDVNLTGAFVVLKHAGRAVVDGGAIVTLASLNARQPGGGMAPYCASKAGVAMLGEVAALEIAHRGVRVNTVSPGLVVTPLTEPAMGIPGIREDYLENTPLARSGEPSEIADAIVFLVSDKARWITGENLDINGGAHLMRYPDLVGHVTRAFG